MDLYELRVFVGPDGAGGNPLGVFLQGTDVPDRRRQAVARELGYSETVFVDDAPRGVVQIFTPEAELPFAGHPLVGTSWLLHRQGHALEALHPPAGEVATWVDLQGRVWIRGRPQWAPDFSFEQLTTPAQVEALSPSATEGVAYVWAWEDEPGGVVRARMFAPALGIAEDEATGAAAVRLVGLLEREVLIKQGGGSRLHAKPGPDGTVDVGGAVVLDAVREHRLNA